jgi:hypothetical protein
MKITIETFTDSALAMIADLELKHGVAFTLKESQRLQTALAAVSQRAWFNSKQGKQALTKTP